ncbi:MAG TPA: peptidylprolyl isomerase [Steroidobacteraceae bacterium]|nr:peptidylprolyl isomerase [Steroidobacteraceae bacterium]
MSADRPVGVAATGALAALMMMIGAATDVDAKPVTVADLLAGSPAADWRAPNPDDTVYLDLPRGRVVIELATGVAPQHAANIKALARAHYFDGLAIIRVQDNYVVQWDDPDHHRPVPAAVRPSVEFTADARAAPRFEPLPDRDLYAPEVGFLDGFPAARDPRTHTVWLAHCYGMVGAGRDDPPESDATEMYAVIGHAPRQLDRNVALFGRVLKGMELLSTLPRGSGEMGFYVASEAPVPIESVRIAADLPAAERTPIEVLRTGSATFRAVLDQRRERHESWFKFNPGRIDLCNVPLPVRTPAGN